MSSFQDKTRNTKIIAIYLSSYLLHWIKYDWISDHRDKYLQITILVKWHLSTGYLGKDCEQSLLYNLWKCAIWLG